MNITLQQTLLPTSVDRFSLFDNAMVVPDANNLFVLVNLYFFHTH